LKRLGDGLGELGFQVGHHLLGGVLVRLMLVRFLFVVFDCLRELRLQVCDLLALRADLLLVFSFERFHVGRMGEDPRVQLLHIRASFLILLLKCVQFGLVLVCLRFGGLRLLQGLGICLCKLSLQVCHLVFGSQGSLLFFLDYFAELRLKISN